MKLLIVESPNKVAKIQGYVGNSFVVVACYGHFRDLPTDEFGVQFKDKRIIPEYQIHNLKVVKRIKDLTKEAESIWLGTDPDREGEAISWHLAQILPKGKPLHRVMFHALTKDAVQKAIAEARSIDFNLVNAQQARRVLDRVVGWGVSPAVWKGVGKEAKSAGRVQSVALRLVAERERAITGFKSKTFFVPVATLAASAPPAVVARLVLLAGEPLKERLVDQAAAEALVAKLKQASTWHVIGAEDKEVSSNPPPPFTTSKVQQAASVRLGFDPERTMELLQRLFEDGKITYLRTDSPALSPEGMAMARAWISEHLPAEYLPAEPRIYAAKGANAQEAHEAIRPTHGETGPDACGTDDAGRLYRLIWERTMASQMASAKDRAIKATIRPEGVNECVFGAKGRVQLFDGWRRLTAGDASDDPEAKHQADDQDDAPLPPLAKGDRLKLQGLTATSRTTKAPPRYTAASLVNELETKGIGRPSTYANIIKTIVERSYVKNEKRKLYATDLGLRVTDYLCERFKGDFIEVEYTATMETMLDRIAAGDAVWEPEVTIAAERIQQMVSACGVTSNFITGEGMGRPEPVPGVICPDCGKGMYLRNGSNGSFYSCMKYPKCKGTLPGPDAKPPEKADGILCPCCGKGMNKVAWKDSVFLACENRSCKGRLNEDGTTGKSHTPVRMDQRCPLCEKAMVERPSPIGAIPRCFDFDCKGARNLDGSVTELPKSGRGRGPQPPVEL